MALSGRLRISDMAAAEAVDDAFVENLIVTPKALEYVRQLMERDGRSIQALSADTGIEVDTILAMAGLD
jgi:hypothetical protein